MATIRRPGRRRSDRRAYITLLVLRREKNHYQALARPLASYKYVNFHTTIAGNDRGQRSRATIAGNDRGQRSRATSAVNDRESEPKPRRLRITTMLRQCCGTGRGFAPGTTRRRPTRLSSTRVSP
jgi:hypothetical protein